MDDHHFGYITKLKAKKKKKKNTHTPNHCASNSLSIFVLYLMFSTAKNYLFMCENIDLDLFFEGPSHEMNMIQLKALRL
jgi:hypothetical protein